MSPPSAGTVPANPGADESWRIFDRIAVRYDLLNRMLSFRRDVAWRKAVYRSLPDGEGLQVLDLATGTADVLLSLSRGDGKVARGLGLDKSSKMLELAKRKIRSERTGAPLNLVHGDAEAIGVRPGAFDAVTMAFGIRNVPDVERALSEIHAVLKPGGRVLILEFSLPGNPLLRALYLAYFRHVLPRIGGWVSGDAEAYRYLNRSVEAFPYGDDFLALLRSAGFGEVRQEPLTCGIATLYQGDK